MKFANVHGRDISAVIPVRNRAHTIRACIESALAQTTPPLEVLVVDDGSTDGTRDIAAEYPGVRVLLNTRTPGAQGARNTGIEQARGRWIAFLDSDDTWLPHKLELQLAALSKHGDGPPPVVHGDALKEHADGRTELIAIQEFSGDAYASLLLHSGPFFPGLLAQRDTLEEIGLLDEQCPSYQEWDTAIRLARKAPFIHVHSPLFCWRWHSSEQISKQPSRDFLGFHYVVEQHSAEVLRIHGPRALRRLQARLLAHGLALGCHDLIAAFAPRNRNFAVPIARWLARRGIRPPGTALILRAAASF